MAFVPMMDKAKLSAATIERPQSILPDGTVAWERLMALAALARALDPSIPPAIRFVKRASSDPMERLTTPFRMVFTARESDGSANEILNDPTATEFWSTLARVTSPEFADAERRLIDTGPKFKFANAQDAAVYGAFKDARVRMLKMPTGDPDHVVQATGATRPPLYPFFRTPELGRALWSSDKAPVDDLPPAEQGFLGRVRQKVKFLRSVLSRPYAEVTLADKEKAFGMINELDRVARPRLETEETVKRLPWETLPTFESEQKHGWIAYALSRGCPDWVAPLLTKAGADPHVSYGGVSPLAWAVAQDNVPAVKQLLSAGATANGLLHGWPKVYDQKHQKLLDGLGEQYIPILSFAAAVGSAKTAKVLIENGAEINGYTDYGRFPLVLAAQNGDERMIRMLVAQGADLNQTDREQRIASEALPVSDELDGLFRFMEQARTSTSEAAPPPLSPPSTPMSSRLSSRNKERAQTTDTPSPAPTERRRALRN